LVFETVGSNDGADVGPDDRVHSSSSFPHDLASVFSEQKRNKKDHTNRRLLLLYVMMMI